MHVRLAERYAMANLPAILVCGRQHAERYTGLTRDLGRERKMAINRAQLAALGLDPSEADLDRHHLLARGGIADRAYLEWAEAWLSDVLAANRRVGRYDHPALARAAGKRWLRLCLRARMRNLRAWRRMFASPLLRSAARAGGWHALWPPAVPPLQLDTSPPAVQ
jgi:hypothetical protein